MLGRELARAKRTGQSLAVSLVDLDGLAGYTARHGAAEADRVLRLAAGGLAGGVRSYDCVCRLDEGEFALVLPGMTAESAAALVGRLASGFGTWSLDGDPITVSGGVAAFPEHAATNDELVRLASAALGRAGDARVIAWDGLAEGADDPVRSLEARGARSADSRAVSEYAGHIAGACGLEPDHVDRVRLAASLDDPAAAGGEEAERRRLAERVAAGIIDDEAAGWLLARFDSVAEAPLEARVIAVAEAFVAAGGTPLAGIGRPRPLGAVAAGGRAAGRGLRAHARAAAGRRARAAGPGLVVDGPQVFLRRCVRWRAAIAASGRGVGVCPRRQPQPPPAWSARARPAAGGTAR